MLLSVLERTASQTDETLARGDPAIEARTTLSPNVYRRLARALRVQRHVVRRSRRQVHERDRFSEFLLIVLRGLLAKRPGLRVVLMSATLQQAKYSGYFGGCPVTTIGSRTFPVQVRSHRFVA